MLGFDNRDNTMGKRGHVADIFLSYAREDLAKAKLLATALKKQGWTVFWDRTSILAGQDFDEVIEQAIESMKCMVVLWSQYSKKSYYVRDEARLGRDKGLLVPVLIDSSLAPMGFGSLHSEDFSAWKGETDSHEFKKLCQAAKRLLDANQSATPSGSPVQAPPSTIVTPGSDSDREVFEPEMVIIPAGSFQMGGNKHDDELPIHQVTILKPFALGKYPVTFAEYDYFAEQTGKAKPDDESWERDSRPVINVSWDDAVAYAGWLAEVTGKQYRLPSEAEWEYAARAGTTGDYYWDGQGETNEFAWLGKDKTQPVGQLKPNAFGLYDMSGNVWEWLGDCWHGYLRGCTGKWLGLAAGTRR